MVVNNTLLRFIQRYIAIEELTFVDGSLKKQEGILGGKVERPGPVQQNIIWQLVLG